MVLTAVIGAAAAGGVEAAGVALAAEIPAATALVAEVPLVANHVMAEAVISAVPEVASSSAQALKGVEAVAKMQEPATAIKTTGKTLGVPGGMNMGPDQSKSISTKESSNEIRTESPKTQIEARDAIYHQKLARLIELRATKDAMITEIKKLEAELGQAEGISPEMIAMIAAAGIVSGMNNQVNKDRKE